MNHEESESGSGTARRWRWRGSLAAAGAMILTLTGVSGVAIASHVMASRSAHPAAARSVAIGGSGQTHAMPYTVVNPTPVASPVLDRPQINWEEPLLATIKTTLAGATKVGSLGFQPLVPGFAVQPTRVLVSNPLEVPREGRSISLVYRFPISAEFPTDGRVLVREQQADEVTVDVLNNVAKGNEASGQYSMILIGGRPALLISAHGIGRITVLTSGLTVDVTGPAVSSEAAIKLAQAIG